MATRARTISRTLVNEFLIRANADIDDNGVRTDYSGRGMYGSKCLGITIPRSDLPALFTAVGVVLGEAESNGDDAPDPLDFAEAAQIDSMGHDIIVYFPRWTLAD